MKSLNPNYTKKIEELKNEFFSSPINTMINEIEISDEKIRQKIIENFDNDSIIFINQVIMFLKKGLRLLLLKNMIKKNDSIFDKKLSSNFYIVLEEDNSIKLIKTDDIPPDLFISILSKKVNDPKMIVLIGSATGMSLSDEDLIKDNVLLSDELKKGLDEKRSDDEFISLLNKELKSFKKRMIVVQIEGRTNNLLVTLDESNKVSVKFGETSEVVGNRSQFISKFFELKKKEKIDNIRKNL